MMYERKNYLKRAFYHLMKLQMKRNKYLQFDGYKQDNYELAEMFARGEAFETDIIFVKDGELFVCEEFFKLNGKEQSAMIDYMSQFLEDAE